MRSTPFRVLSASVIVAASVGVGAHFVSGAGDGVESVYVPSTPCRLVDTRPNTTDSPTINVGPRDTKLGPDGTQVFTAWETGDGNSPCDIPETATAISANVVAVQPTARSYLTLYPGDVDNPGTANVNFVADQAPTPNSATIPLSPTGTFTTFNKFGDVHVVIDVSGYFRPASGGGTPGPAGPPGADGTDLFDRTIVVRGGGTPAENGARLLAAVETANTSGPSAVDPWLVTIEPGVFDVGATQLLPAEYVSIEGSGQGITTVQGAIRSNSVDTAAIVVARRITISDLTIRNTGGPGDGNFAVGIYTRSVASSAHRITIETSGTRTPIGVSFQVNAEFDLVDSTIESVGDSATGLGNASTSNSTSLIRIIRSTITSTSAPANAFDVSQGVGLRNGTLQIEDSTITADTPVYVGSSALRTLTLDARRSRFVSNDETPAPRSIDVFTSGTTNASLGYVEVSHVTDLDDATVATCRATIGPLLFSSSGCPT